LLRIEVAKDAELREKAKQATPWIGYQCGDKPLRHRCVRPKDAKTGNLVLLDVRNANNTKDMLTGDWEASYQLGTVASRQVDNTDDTLFVLHLVMWEPYFKDETNEFRPLWVENALRARRGQTLLPSFWPDVVRLPWCPVKQVPLEITRKLLNNPSFNPSKKDLAVNFMKSGVDCMKQSKGYRQTQLAGTVRHVFQFDINERRKNIIIFNAISQRDILVEIARTEGHDDVDYIYTT
jgi:hypothetical protein